MGTLNNAQDSSQAKERESKLNIKVANWEFVWVTILQEFTLESIFDCFKLPEFPVAISDSFVSDFQRRSGNSVSDVYWQ